MQRWTLPLLVTLAASLIGCGGSNPAAPLDQSALHSAPASVTVPTVTNAHLGSPAGLPDATLTPAALWTLDIDPVTLTASTRNITERSAQASGDTYLLDIAHFFAQTPLEVTQVERLDDRLRVRYTITHPIPPSNNPDAPASATNRADLGVAGITLLLVDALPGGPVYFPDASPQIQANTSLVTNADGYFYPGGLIIGTGQANAFPFRRLVDDAGLGSRIDHPNSTPGFGNFAGSTGWQRSNWGADRMGWTGYGALHQGQTTANEFDLALDAIGDAPMSLQVALIVRYTTPVGGATPAERLVNRLPPAVKDPTKFMYRMPHGAWDLERVVVAAVEGELQGRDDSTVRLHVHVTDWDARAIETTQAQLSSESNAAKVAQGHSGFPEFWVSLPAIPGIAPTTGIDGATLLRNDDSAYGGDPGTDNGGAHDPLYFRFPVDRTGTIASGTGTQVGLIRIRDAAADLAADTSLDGALQPLTADIPQVETYQSFVVEVRSSAAPINVALETDPVISGTAPVLLLSSGLPGENEFVQIDWNADGDLADPAEDFFYEIDATEMTLTAPAPEINATLTPRADQLILHVRAASESFTETLTVPFMVGPNRAPMTEGAPVLNALTLPSPANFRLLAWEVTDPEGDPISFTSTNNRQSGEVSGAVLPLTLTATPLAFPPTLDAEFQLYVNDALHPATSGTPAASIPVTVTAPEENWWVKPLSMRSNALVRADAAGNVYVFGDLRETWDFGGGPLASDDDNGLFLVCYTQEGEYQWGKVINGVAGADALEVMSDGELAIAGSGGGIIDFGGGARDLETDHLFIARFGPDGTWRSDYHVKWPPGFLYGITIAMAPNGAMVATGGLRYNATIDFGGGPRTTAGNMQTYQGFILGLDGNCVYQWDHVYQPSLPFGGGVLIFDLAIGSDGVILASGQHGGEIDYGGGLRTTTTFAALLLELEADGSYRSDRLFQGDGAHFRRFYAAEFTTAPAGIIAVGDAGPATDLGNGPTAHDYFIVRLDDAGVWQWEHSSYGLFRTVVEDPATGAVYATGEMRRDADLGTGLLTFAGGQLDAILASYAADGTPRWGFGLGSTQAENGRHLALLPDGGLVLGGGYEWTLDVAPGPEEYILTPQEEQEDPSFLVRLNKDTGRFY